MLKNHFPIMINQLPAVLWVLWFLFPKLRKFLSGRRYKSRQALGSAISQCLRGLPKSAYCDTFQKWIQRLKLCISNHREYFEGMKCSFHYLSQMLLRYRTVHITYWTTLVSRFWKGVGSLFQNCWFHDPRVNGFDSRVEPELSYWLPGIVFIIW